MPPRSGTAWTSDRIRPPSHKPSTHLAAQTPSKSDKGKGKVGTPGPPRSAAVRKLDELLAGLRSSSSSEPARSQHLKDDGVSPLRTGASVKRARTRSPNTPRSAAPAASSSAHYTAPYRACPHCAAQLLDTAARAALLVQLEERRAHTLVEEASARARVAEELRLAEGAFPALGAGALGPGPGVGKGGARVLSLVGQRVKVESYRATSALLEDVEADAGADDGVVVRVPPPPREVQYIRVPRGSATRWTVSKGGEGGAKYVAPPPAPRGQSDHAAGRRRGKGKARDVTGT